MKKLLAFSLIMASLFLVVPVETQGEEINNTVKTAQDNNTEGVNEDIINETIATVEPLELALDTDVETDITMEVAHSVTIVEPQTTTMYATQTINIRQEPSTDAVVLGKFNRNDEVPTLNKINDEWYEVKLEGTNAFVHAGYLSTEQVSTPSYSEDDLYIMAHVLAGECHTYPEDEQKYVGSVVLNRVNSSRYPNTIRGVVFQKGQYACTWDGNYYRTPTARNWEIAKWLLENGSILPSNVVYQSGGKQGHGVYVKTKWHYYCMY